ESVGRAGRRVLFRGIPATRRRSWSGWHIGAQDAPTPGRYWNLSGTAVTAMDDKLHPAVGAAFGFRGIPRIRPAKQFRGERRRDQLPLAPASRAGVGGRQETLRQARSVSGDRHRESADRARTSRVCDIYDRILSFSELATNLPHLSRWKRGIERGL